jgi:2'-5' RNA ligase
VLGDPAGALGDLPNADFNGSRVTLYRSRLLAGGARYEALASVALGNSGPTQVV